ncbi:MAG: DUF1489 domain-containing protein [Paracoccaceae bacterium]|nr:DUF1489 domain-containing protein [Paracoccaceae bacterium]
MGAQGISDLYQRQNSDGARTSNKAGRKVVHVTRMWPKRENELLAGGSLYWVIKGLILARQEILGLEEIIGSDHIKRCGIVLSEKIVKTSPKPKRAFQGWRYLTYDQAPPDVGDFSTIEEEIPHSLQLELSRLGVL